MFSGKTTTEALSWERLHQQQNLGSVKQNTSLFCLPHQIYQLQVDMLSMLHGATPSYENLGGMFPGQYQ